jgi:nitric oxide reductase NorQ protein
VVLHPVTDDRRILPLDRTGELLEAPPGFMLVASYNPGYQNILKTLKPSTRQRFLSIEFGFPTLEAEAAIVAHESGLPQDRCVPLVKVARALRDLKGQDLEEGASTRLVVYCAILIRDGVKHDVAIHAALLESLTDDPEVLHALERVASITLG